MLTTLNPADFFKVYEIMDESFPADEYRSFDGQKALLDDPHYQIYVFTDDASGDIRAFITVWQFDGFGYIEHFAVSGKYRGGGIGSLVLKETAALLNCPICLEVEPPETDFSRRRIEFYKRNGFFLNEYPYIQPPISEGKNPLPLLIMTSGGKISRETFERYQCVLYKYVYKTDTLAK